ncbi:site-specific DNA-methyltransferase [Metamycoplasma hyosynoviae]|uniref:site-specific DNA-methyltransferase n=1 Tax=Metamycoplasma hyosynoviae TaxID=29559 RepID=UPI00249ABF20|nr:site-specific DNA-methyltransferase [Metamycoplasma hyosynoviae]MDI3063715.1 site-specific DNA-methyltransferase [Metamycoplasma hyosynoviae]
MGALFNENIVLNFPFKDCILYGGQTKDDQKREEIFYNKIIASDQINQMLAPKVFTNIKRYSKNNIENKDIIFDKNDNLIIKGNNLIALSSILKVYEGKVKCIYIDPPYNTGSDSFSYNDSFNRTTWLVFMKNRLEIAKKLLSDDGILLIQISFHQFPYLRVLVDEIFSDGKHIMDFNTLVRNTERILTGDKEYNDVIEYTLVYSKSKNFKMPKMIKQKEEDLYCYEIILEKDPEKCEKIKIGNKEVVIYKPGTFEIKTGEPNFKKLKMYTITGSISEKNSSGRFFEKYLRPLINDKNYPPETMFAVFDMGDDERKYRLFQFPKAGKKAGRYFQGKPKSSDVTLKPYPNFLNYAEKYNAVNKEGGVSFRNAKKPEEYIKFYFDIFTSENDLVLDFFLGSGTTCAVAHKMNRKYIGIEQMDYINNITVERLNNVIKNDDTGISKEIGWKGGGSFVYCELLEDAYELLNSIISANEDEIKKIKTEIYCDQRIIPFISTNELLKVDNEFDKLDLKYKKQILIDLININKLYVNYSDIDDKNYKVSESDKKFTKSFYGNR